MISKQQRQALILDIIQKQSITSQEALLTELQRHHVMTTQTTVSRDIRALGIVRIKDVNGALRYQQLQDQTTIPGLAVTASAVDEAIKEYAVFIQQVQFMTIIKTTDSTGNALAGVIDDADLPEVIATLAGFDTIYVTTPDDKSAAALTARWSALIG
ncbi:arginine repressor [Leuconostoc citreum]|uniref:arginine repressor n=1 Tax=Leuconostoc citreum TaxID=33964 RepID=UPI0021A8AD5A|nr:arginine repressor [Leuconostoc citreum]MCT3075851.1 arginine repressor [Leuconostoc citreum]